MLKIILAVLAVGFAALAPWRQAVQPPPRHYGKVHVVSRPGEAAHPEIEDAARETFASSFRQKHLLTPLQLVVGLALCGSLLVALAIAAVLFTHQHFHIKERLGLEKPAPVSSAAPATIDGAAPSNP